MKEHYPNYWEFSGGKIEQNETPAQCLTREFKEELGINVIGEKYKGEEHISTDSYTLPSGDVWWLHGYYLKYKSGSIVLNPNEVHSVKMMNVSELFQVYLENEVTPGIKMLCSKVIERMKADLDEKPGFNNIRIMTKYFLRQAPSVVSSMLNTPEPDLNSMYVYDR